MSTATLPRPDTNALGAEIEQLSASILTLAHAAIPMLDNTPAEDDLAHVQRLLYLIQDQAQKALKASCNVQGL